MGRPLFEVFPDNNTNNEATGVLNLRSSLECVIAQKELHQMADQRYDIVNPETRSFEFKVWAASNKPVLNSEETVQYIIHTTEDITERVRLHEENALRRLLGFACGSNFFQFSPFCKALNALMNLPLCSNSNLG